jgi:hypothetical protein
LAPNDFYLFKHLKRRLGKCHRTTKEEVIRNVTENLDSISEEELVQVFVNWLTGLKEVISTSGEYT